MFVQAKTLPWIPGQSSRPAALVRQGSKRRRPRGMGDAVPLQFPYVDSQPYTPAADGSDGTGTGVPCMPAGSIGPLAFGQSYCGAPAQTGTTDNWDAKSGTTSAQVCFQPLFPWVGQATPNGGCKPVVAVKDPWPLVITVGLGAFLGFRLLGGR